MKAFNFVHTADLHLDSPFLGLREVDQHVATELREATFRSFDRIVDLCLERGADFLLVAGDIYDSRDRSLRAQLRFRDGLKRLTDAGISSFVVHGNHDPLDSWAATLEWPKRAHVFGGKRVTGVPVVRNGETIAYVYGISYPTQEVRQNLAERFRRADDAPFAIGLLHCNVGENTGHEPYAPCTLESLTKCGMDYWGLGHVHNQRMISHEKPMVVYAGNPQGRHPGELGARGCYMVTVDEEGRPAAEFVPVDTIRWFWETVPTEELGSDEALIRAVEAACQRVREQAESRPAVGRITLVGRSPIHQSLVRPGFVAELAQRVREAEGSETPFVWVERIDVATRPPVDVEARRSGHDFVADLLSHVERYRVNSELLQPLGERLEPLFRRAHRFLESPTDEELREWLEEAEVMCLDLLVAEEE